MGGRGKEKRTNGIGKVRDNYKREEEGSKGGRSEKETRWVETGTEKEMGHEKG